MSKLHPSKIRMPKYEKVSWRRMVIESKREGHLCPYAIPVGESGKVPEILYLVSGEIAEVVSNSSDWPVQEADITKHGLALRHVYVFVSEIRPDLPEPL